MHLLAIVSDEVHLAALRKARQLGNDQRFRIHLFDGPLDGEVTDCVNRIWNEMEGALRRAHHEGVQAARPLIESISASMTDLLAPLGTRAEQVRTAIAERLNTYLQTSIDGALERIRATMKVGGRELSMVSMTVQQKINLSGSLKASLQEVCTFVASGEISLSAEYALVPDSILVKSKPA